MNERRIQTNQTEVKKLIYKGLHPTDDVERLCVSTKEEGRGLFINRESVNTSIRRLHKKEQGKIIMVSIAVITVG